MARLELDRKNDNSCARGNKLAFAAVFMCVLLSACVDDSDWPVADADADVESDADAAAPASSSSAALVATPSPGGVGSTTLSWSPPTRNDDGTALALTGYRIYWGLNEGHFPHSVTIQNPGLSRYVVSELAPATYYFVATALSADGESPPSNVVRLQVL